MSIKYYIMLRILFKLNSFAFILVFVAIFILFGYSLNCLIQRLLRVNSFCNAVTVMARNGLKWSTVCRA